MQTPEIILRTAAVLGCGLLAGLLVTSRRRDHTHWLGGLYCLGVIAFVLTSMRGAEGLLGVWFYPLVLLCVTKAAWFWLFAKGLFTEDFRVQAKHFMVVTVVGVYGLWQQLVFVPARKAAFATDLESVVSLGFDALVLGLVVLVLFEVWRGLAADLVERRRRMRVLFVAAVAGYLAIAVLVQIYNTLLGVSTPPSLMLANLALMFGLSVAAALSLVQMRTASWLAPERRPAPDELGESERRLLATLNHAMETEHIYREEGLTIGALAERLRTREHILRRVINRGLGFRNFNDFLHAHRIREASMRLRRPEDARLPVLSIALEVGYSSIGPFNRAFKSRVGMTPSSFRRLAGGGS
jgi:AraC-like DNA-binding protein